MDLEGLNPSQRQAVTCTEGPLLVLAGAGSGKTRVITHRVAYLLEQGVDPGSIVALSFTNKAAGEMQERLAHMIGEAAASELVLSTFHSLGVRMMRDDPKGFGLPGNRFSILDQGDVSGMLRSLLREYGHQGQGMDRRFDVYAIVQRISLWKNDFVTPEQAAELPAETVYDELAAELFGPYEERLQALGAVDFDDLVCRIAGALRDEDKVRRKWQRRFRYLMVDEYQDTNAAQLEMVRQLAGEARNVCVVGDDDQAIYGWRGANVANILSFETHFPGAQVVKLERNYRSRPPILATANASIVNNRYRHDKKLKATKRGGKPVLSVVAPTGADEAKWVGKRIRKLLTELRISADDVAVLYRSAIQARAIEELLKEHGIDYRVLGGQSVYDKKEVKDALAYLKVLVTPRDELAVRRALETPPRGIGPRTMAVLHGHAERTGGSLLDAVHQAGSIEGVPYRAVEALGRFSAMVRAGQARARKEKNVAAGLREILDAVDLRGNVVKEMGSEEAAQARWGGVEWLLRSVGRWEGAVRRAGRRPKWHEYLGNLALDSKAEQEADANAPPLPDTFPGQVSLATLHSAKGLEWDYVFLIGCEEGQLPHRRVAAPRASDAVAGDLEEERRLFYVGVTRAREQLWLTRAKARTDRGREAPREPSRFLTELPEDAIQNYVIEQEEELTSDAIGAMADAFLARFQTDADDDSARSG